MPLRIPWPQAISGRYRLNLSESMPAVLVLERSIPWATEGTGDEDQGVDAMALVEPEGSEGVPKPDHWREFEAIVSERPLSYDGLIVMVVWRVRVRPAVGKDPEWLGEVTFRLEKSSGCRGRTNGKVNARRMGRPSSGKSGNCRGQRLDAT